MKSIIQDNKECFLTGATGNLHCHHIFGSANRKNSEKYGLKVWLMPELHNMSNRGVHFDRELMDMLHRVGQRAFEKKWGSRADFMRIFGKNYLYDDDKGAENDTICRQ